MTRILDGARHLEFEGELLGHATSRRGSDVNLHRWTEVFIWKTEGGKYIVQKTGKSRVYHEAGSERASGEAFTSQELRDLYIQDPDRFADLVGDTVAKPRPIADLMNWGYGAVIETERSNCHIATTAAGVVESLYNQDDKGVVYITKIAQRALKDATDKDPALLDAWKVERVG